MVNRYSKTEESKKEFYFYLGLLSTKFAIMESNLLKMLGLLIVDNFVLTSTILERNSLAQNIELLKKVNNYRGYEENAIKSLTEKIAQIKSKRNLFIHGIWGEPFEYDNDVIISCYEPKLIYDEEINNNGEKISKTWTSSNQHEFRLTYIKKLVENIGDIITAQDYLISKLEEHTFD
jgi:hypothetical protein